MSDSQFSFFFPQKTSWYIECATLLKESVDFSEFMFGNI